MVLASTAYATSLANACNPSRIRNFLPEDGYILGVTFDKNSVTANAVYNSSYAHSVPFPDATTDFCNVTFSCTHTELDQSVILGYYVPVPNDFKNRFLATGGSAYAIQSDSMSAPGGVMYGAVSGFSDGGFVAQIPILTIYSCLAAAPSIGRWFTCSDMMLLRK